MIAYLVLRRGNESESPRFRSSQKAISMIACVAVLEMVPRSAIAQSLLTASTRPTFDLHPGLRDLIVGTGRKQANDQGGHIWTAIRRCEPLFLDELGFLCQRRAKLFAHAFPLLRAAIDVAKSFPVSCRLDPDFQGVAVLAEAIQKAIAGGEIEIYSRPAEAEEEEKAS